MNDFFAADDLPGLLLGVLAIELLVLLLLWRLRGLGVPPAPLLAFLGSGACLTMALRAAMTGQGAWVAPWLAAALPLHLAWLALAWRRGQGDATFPILPGGTPALGTLTGTLTGTPTGTPTGPPAGTPAGKPNGTPADPRTRVANMASSRTESP